MSAEYPPFYTVDRDAWDFSRYDPDGTIVFNVELESAVQHILGEFRARGSTLEVAFYDCCLFEDRVSTAIALWQGGSPTYHTELWLGAQLAVLATSSVEGVNLFPWGLDERRREAVRLPFADPELAFRVCVDTVRRCQAGGVRYSAHYLWMALHGMRDVFGVPSGGDDYDEERPETWTGGVHCSQLVLLFLKRCVRRGALRLEGSARRRLLGTHTHTCLPRELRLLLQELWGPSLTAREVEYPSRAALDLWYDPFLNRKSPPPLPPCKEEERLSGDSVPV